MFENNFINFLLFKIGQSPCGKTNGFAAESSTHGTMLSIVTQGFSSGRELNSKIYFDKRAMWDSWVKKLLICSPLQGKHTADSEQLQNGATDL